ncbi:MAG: glycosyl transferase family 2 [Anaerolineae bacterium]|nr:glycosyl transferase family 2 [Anaerolineae bacterium]
MTRETTGQLPSISIIVAARPGCAAAVLDTLPALAYPQERVEVLVAEGLWPPNQHNVAGRKARGELLYFLDDDSIPHVDILNRAAAHFEDSAVAVVGGPSLTAPGSPLFQRCVGYVLGTRLGAWTMRARYTQVGQARSSCERELLTCNLVVRRDVFLSAGGFSPLLFPNDETELLARLGKSQVLIHDPNLVVYRPQRAGIGALVAQFFSYGRGRTRQMRLSMQLAHVVFLLPLLWWLCLLALLLVASPMCHWMIGIGTTAALAAAVVIAVREREIGALFWVPFIVTTIYAAYGAGLGAGILWSRAPAARQKAPVSIRRIKELRAGWHGVESSEKEHGGSGLHPARWHRRKQESAGTTVAWQR